jgi:hypothetical protein
MCGEWPLLFGSRNCYAISIRNRTFIAATHSFEAEMSSPVRKGTRASRLCMRQLVTLSRNDDESSGLGQNVIFTWANLSLQLVLPQFPLERAYRNVELLRRVGSVVVTDFQRLGYRELL